MEQYKNLKKLITSLYNNLDSLDKGNLSFADLYSMLDDARNIHERIAILHYMAMERSVKKDDEDNGLNFNFSKEKTDETPENQTSLIDAIETEEHLEAVKNSIGEQKPLFEFDSKKLAQNKPEYNKESTQYKTNDIDDTDVNSTINDKFSSNADKPTLAEKLGKQPIKDLTKHIGLNQKFLFMNDLFEGENDKYKIAIDKINNFSIFDEANKYVKELELEYSWDMDSSSAKKFIELISRRFIQ